MMVFRFTWKGHGTMAVAFRPHCILEAKPALQGLMGLQVVSTDCWLETWFQHPPRPPTPNSLVTISNKQNLRPTGAQT